MADFGSILFASMGVIHLEQGNIANRRICDLKLRMSIASDCDFILRINRALSAECPCDLPLRYGKSLRLRFAVCGLRFWGAQGKHVQV